MKLLLFKAHSDGDYGALCFEQSDETVESCYERMKAENCDTVTSNSEDRDEDDEDEGADWELTLVQVIHVRDQEEADKIMDTVGTVAAEDFCGDYDHQKNTNYCFLLVGDDDATPQPTR